MVKDVLREREETHGNFESTAAISQSIKEAFGIAPKTVPYIAQESLDMIATKMARILCGDWRNKDHWVDIAGYAQLVVDSLEEE